MKNILKSCILTAIFGIALFSCNKDKDPVPVITIGTQPANATVTQGGIAGNLTVAASVTEKATLAYQWYSNTSASSAGGATVSGATSATFAIPTNLTAAGSPYYYFCEVSAKGATSVRSSVATVTVNPAAAVVPNIVLAIAAGSYTYDGTAQTPACTVTADGATLAAGTDYDIAFSNNTNAGTATVVATGKGTYAGKTDTKTFTIAKCAVTVTPDDDQGKTFWDNDDPVITYTTAPADVPGVGLTGKLARAVGTDVNTYAITQGDLGGANYEVTLTAGKLFTIYLFKGTGADANNAYEIGRLEQFLKFRDLVSTDATYNSNSVYFKLTSDIDLNNEAWTPICGGGKDFRGHFDGNKHKVVGLYINTASGYGDGLFSHIGISGTIQNLGVEGKIENASYAGGVAGIVEGSIINCYSNVSLSGENTRLGGIAGAVGGIVRNCYATGSISSLQFCVGGIVGEGSAIDCAALNPSVTGSSDAGRVVGSGTATNCVVYSGMTVNGATVSDGGINGTGMTKAQIQADGTLGGRFPNDGNPWTTANGKLPGFGAAIDLPAHLK